MSANINLHHGDCIDIMQSIDSDSIDLVLADPPYGITACKWDSVIDLAEMWDQLRRITKNKAAIVLNSSQPFTTTLISSNREMFKYCWVWEKSRSTGFLQSKYMPMKSTEDVCVFCKSGKTNYNPIKTTGHKPTNSAVGYGHSPTFGNSKERNYKGGDTERFPKNIQYFKSERGLHPTQKPVDLMEYMVRTYGNEGDTVLDFAMGSGTTGVACRNLNRKFIGIEIEKEYFDIAEKRILTKE